MSEESLSAELVAENALLRGAVSAFLSKIVYNADRDIWQAIPDDVYRLQKAFRATSSYGAGDFRPSLDDKSIAMRKALDRLAAAPIQNEKEKEG